MCRCLGGTLLRTSADQWRWSDGTPEPRVTDMSISAVYNFRCRAFADRTYVEVILSAIQREPDVLGWIKAGVIDCRYAQGQSGDHTGPRVISEDGDTPMRIEPGEDPLLGNEPIISKRAIPRVALVPVEEWDAWAAAHPYGARWDKADEESILSKAGALGWSRPI